MKLKRIRSIDILGVKHRVRHVDTGEKGGFYDTENKLIEVDKDLTSKELYLETILHEGFHGVFELTGIHQDITLVQEHVISDSIITFLKKNFDIEFKK
jgi:hypothetical protein